MEDVKVSRSVHPAPFDAEAMRLVSSSPDWLPGKEGVNEVSYEIPIDFNKQWHWKYSVQEKMNP